MVGPAGVGVRRAAGGRTGAGPVIILGAAWAVAAREKARAATVSKKFRRKCRDSGDTQEVRGEAEKKGKAGKKKNKRKPLVHALATRNAQAHQSTASGFPFPM